MTNMCEKKLSEASVEAIKHAYEMVEKLEEAMVKSGDRNKMDDEKRHMTLFFLFLQHLMLAYSAKSDFSTSSLIRELIHMNVITVASLAKDGCEVDALGEFIQELMGEIGTMGEVTAKINSTTK